MANKTLVISDVHGNREALQAVLEQEPLFDDLVFLGDAASPGPQPSATIGLLKTLPGIHICGNHDLELLDPSLTDNWPVPWKALNDWDRKSLSSEDFEYLKNLEPDGSYSIGGRDLFLCHGNLLRHPRHVLPTSACEDFQALGAQDDSDIVLFGHSHVQFAQRIGTQLFANPGSVGQNRCGKPVACYGVLENGEFYHRHVEYDTSPLLDAIYSIDELNEFPNFRDWFAESLTSGFGLGKTKPWTDLAAEGYM
ncbi:MAG: metallophosphoesterase family protein [Gammaproteobacteria bacterium]|nr:metallophosphoesterase family protein [Gammaproteobacteria bacterium]